MGVYIAYLAFVAVLTLGYFAYQASKSVGCG